MQQNGHCLVYGVSTTDKTVVTVGTYYAKAFVDSAPVARRAKLDEHVGTNGKTAAFVWTNPYYELSLTVRPASSTNITDADAQARYVPNGAAVVLSGFKPVLNAIGGSDILNGSWIHVGADTTITLNKDEPATADLTLRRYVDTAQHDTLATQLYNSEA